MNELPYQVNLVIQYEGDLAVRTERIEEAACWVLAHEGVAPGAELSVVLSDDKTLHELNLRYRGIDRPTDVLSFAADRNGTPEGEPAYLGDLILSIPTIERQAQDEQHTVEDGVLLAVVHGTLHLLGYDHDTADSQEVMWAVQAEALAALNVAVDVPRFSFDDTSSDEATSGSDSDGGTGECV